MGHGRGPCRAAGRRRARHGSRGGAVPLRQAGLPQRQFSGPGPRARADLMTGQGARTADYARLVAVPAIWGGTFVAGRHVVAVMSPMMGSFSRYVIAVVALLAAAFALEGGLPRLSRRQWLGTFILGLLGVFAYNLFFMASLEHLPASRAALIIALNPVITITIS